MGQITFRGSCPDGAEYEIVDCTGCVVMPGLVPAHLHMCQSLARGRADDKVTAVRVEPVR